MYKNKVTASHEKEMQALSFSVMFTEDLPRRDVEGIIHCRKADGLIRWTKASYFLFEVIYI